MGTSELDPTTDRPCLQKKTSKDPEDKELEDEARCPDSQVSSSFIFVQSYKSSFNLGTSARDR